MLAGGNRHTGHAATSIDPADRQTPAGFEPLGFNRRAMTRRALSALAGAVCALLALPVFALDLIPSEPKTVGRRCHRAAHSPARPLVMHTVSRRDSDSTMPAFGNVYP